MTKKKVPKEIKKEAVKLYLETSMSLKAISKELDNKISPSTIRKSVDEKFKDY